MNKGKQTKRLCSIDVKRNKCKRSEKRKKKKEKKGTWKRAYRSTLPLDLWNVAWLTAGKLGEVTDYPGFQSVHDRAGDRLGKNICQVVSTIYSLNNDGFGPHLFTNRVIFDVNVLASLVPYRVLGQSNSTIVVHIDGDRRRRGSQELSYKWSKKTGLLTCMKQGHILCLAGTCSNSLLLTTLPRNHVGASLKHITRDREVGVAILCKVTVTVCY